MINRIFVANALRLLSKQIFAASEDTENKLSLSSKLYIHNPKDAENPMTLDFLKKFDKETQLFLTRISKTLKNANFKEESKNAFKERNISGEKLSWKDVAGVKVEACSFQVIEGKPSSLISSCYIEDKKFVLIDLKKDVQEGFDDDETVGTSISPENYKTALSKLFSAIKSKIDEYINTLADKEYEGFSKEEEDVSIFDLPNSNNAFDVEEDF